MKTILFQISVRGPREQVSRYAVNLERNFRDIRDRFPACKIVVLPEVLAAGEAAHQLRLGQLRSQAGDERKFSQAI